MIFTILYHVVGLVLYGFLARLAYAFLDYSFIRNNDISIDEWCDEHPAREIASLFWGMAIFWPIGLVGWFIVRPIVKWLWNHTSDMMHSVHKTITSHAYAKIKNPEDSTGSPFRDSGK